MSLLNFLSRLTYENILSPMVLARSGNNSMALGILLGGFLAEYIFEPFMQSENAVAQILTLLVGNGNGRTIPPVTSYVKDDID